MSSAVVTDLTMLCLLKPYGGNRCAADVLGLFKWFASKERPGYWFKARYVDIAQYLGNLYSKQAIASATKLLNDLGVLLQHKHSRDGQIRTFYYEFCPEKLKAITETLEVQNETLEVQNETLSIYINPPSLSPPFLDPLSDPWNEEKEKEGDEIFEEQDIPKIIEEAISHPEHEVDPSQGKCSAASSPVQKKRISEKEVWEIAPSRPYPVFLNWWAATKYKPQGGHWAADALGNAYAEFYNNREKTAIAIFPQFLEYMERVTENCNQSLNAEFKALLPSHFILRPESTSENVHRLMERVQSLVERGIEIALPQSATPASTQSMSFESATGARILPLPEAYQLADQKPPTPINTLKEEILQKQTTWRNAPILRDTIAKWVSNTPGVTIGADGPELEGGVR